MEKDKETVLKVLAFPTVLIMLFIAFIPLGIFNAWAVQKLYGWFLLPIGAPALNIWHVWGISLILSHYLLNNDIDNKKFWEKLVISLLTTLLMLLFGFILKGHI